MRAMWSALLMLFKALLSKAMPHDSEPTSEEEASSEDLSGLSSEDLHGWLQRLTLCDVEPVSDIYKGKVN